MNEQNSPTSQPHDPHDFGYIKCDPCINGNHAECIGLTHTRPFCGCRCPYLEVIDDDLT